jgi:tetratricopeptide (TPR) repeat protein
MEEETKDQLIQDYLEGNLKGEALKDFEKRLKEDTTLATEVEEYQHLELGLHSIGVHQFKDEVSRWETAYQHSQRSSHKGYALRPYYAIAASIALFLTVGIYLFMNRLPGMDQLYTQHYVPYEDMILDRSDVSEGAKSFLIAGMEAYNHQQYPVAVKNLKEYLQQEPEHYGAALYLGIAQMEINDFDASEASFNLSQNDPKFEQQAQWYLSLLYLKSEQLERAKTSLQSILENSQHYKFREAEELLEDIE